MGYGALPRLSPLRLGGGLWSLGYPMLHNFYIYLSQCGKKCEENSNFGYLIKVDRP
jgi:hypothetical protein